MVPGAIKSPLLGYFFSEVVTAGHSVTYNGAGSSAEPTELSEEVRRNECNAKAKVGYLAC